MRNPYEPTTAAGTTPLDRLSRDIDAVAERGVAMDRIPVLIGQEGMGASPALRSVAHDAERHGFVCVAVTLEDASRSARLLERAIRDRFRPITRWARGWHARDTTRESAATLGLSLRAIGLSSKVSRDDEVSRGGLAELLRHAARTARTHDHRGLVVAIDQLHSGSPDDFAVLAHALKDAIGPSPDGKAVPLAVVAAGRPGAVDRLAAVGGLEDTIDVVPMEPLGDEAAREALLAPARRAGVTWDPRAVDEIVAAAHGSPQLLQSYAHEAWAQAAPLPVAPRVDLAHAHAGIDLVQERLRHGRFAATWRSVTEEERSYLRAMAQTTNGLSEARTDHVALLVDGTPQDAGRVRESLVDKGVVESAGSGSVRFAVPGFEAYVLETADLGRYSQADLDARLTAPADAELPPLRPMTPHRSRHAAEPVAPIRAGMRPPAVGAAGQPALPPTAPARALGGRHRRQTRGIGR